MKRLLIPLLLMMALVAGAKDASDLRIYINPGHGSWTSNDRPMATIKHGDVTAKPGATEPDTCNFYESNTDLQRGFGLLDALREAGLTYDATFNTDNADPSRRGPARDLRNNIFMSRTASGPYPCDSKDTRYNRPLTEIAEEVEVNGFDFFISLHSNAVDNAPSTNYPLILFRGKDGDDYSKGSLAAANAIWPYVTPETHQNWSNTTLRLRGDMSFYSGTPDVNTFNGKSYTGYLGALRHGVPGVLIEQYFHTYAPSRHRAMCFDTDRLQGRLVARGILDYFDVPLPETGDIYGIVRADGVTMQHSLWQSPRGNDKYMPVNGATVRLSRDGREVASYVTDDEYNGAFVFTALTPGTYTITVTHPDYSNSIAGTFTVEEGKTLFPEIMLAAPSPTEAAYAYDVTADPQATTISFRLNNACRARVLLTPVGGGDPLVVADDYFGAGLNTIAYDISDQDGVEYALSIVTVNEANSTPAQVHKNTTITKARGVTIDTDPMSPRFGRVYVYDNFLSKKGMYVLDGEHHVLNTTPYDTRKDMNKNSKGEIEDDSWIRLQMLPSGRVMFSDYNDPSSGIFVFDPTNTAAEMKNLIVNSRRDDAGILYKENGTKLGGSTTDCVPWIDADGARHYISYQEDYPAKSLVTFRMGHDETVGDIESSWPTIQSLLGSGNVDITATERGLILSQQRASSQNTASIPSMLFVDWQGNILWRSNEHFANTWHATSHALSPDGTTLAVGGYYAANPHIVRLYSLQWDDAGVQLTDAGTITLDSSTTGNRIGQLVFDPAGNLHIASEQQGYNVWALPRQPDYEVVTETPITLLTNQAAPGIFAYDISIDRETGIVDFWLAGNAHGRIELIPEGTETVTHTVEGNFVRGKNSVGLNVNALPVGTYTVRIVIETTPLTRYTHLFTSTVHSEAATVAVNTNMGHRHFGKIYVGDPYYSEQTGQGLYIYNAAFEAQNTAPYHQHFFTTANNHSPYRMSVLPSGNVAIADWSDAHSGLFLLDPDNPEREPVNMMQGTRESSGRIVNGSTVVGGPRRYLPHGVAPTAHNTYMCLSRTIPRQMPGASCATASATTTPSATPR